MNSEIFTVLDMVASRYVEPFFSPTAEYALRGFKQAAQKEGHAFNDHPADYALFHIGTFDEESGVLTPLEPRKLAVASSFTSPQGVE